MMGSDPSWLRRAERAEFSKMLRERLSSEDILLYDAAGNPIPKGSDLWAAGQAAWRRRAHELLDHLLNKMPATTMPAPEKLIEALKAVSQSEPKYDFDVVDGKLSVPFSFTVGQVKMKGHIPLYRLGVIGAAVLGLWLVRFKKTPPESHPTGFHPVEFPTWKTIKLGTHKSCMDLANALKDGGFEIVCTADMMEVIIIAPVETEIELVNVSGAELGLEELAPRQVIYDRATKQRNLDLVPAEAGPQLRLQYSDQPVYEYLTMAMEPITDHRSMFWVLRTRDSLCLSSCNGNLCDPSSRWVFARHK